MGIMTTAIASVPPSIVKPYTVAISAEKVGVGENSSESDLKEIKDL